ncbi:MAG: protein kinase [Kofleriaceae bacterium]
MEPRGIIGNYVVEHELGRGGMGVVYAAKHRVLGKPAAIKVLLANTIEHRDRVERFFNEARAAMAIDHPGVVTIHDVGIASDDRAYIAMELLDGSSLATHLQRGPLPLRTAIDYARQIADALAAAHDAGVIHRDLKPENIIVTEHGARIVLVDFGIAKLADSATVRTATGALMGTPLYMSPEQCEGLREIDARTDLYSLGCVIFAMLTGRPPFDNTGTGGLIGAHLHLAPPRLRVRCPAASEALERVVAVLLAKSRDDRFRTARAVSAALAAPEVSVLAAGQVAATADIVPMPIQSTVETVSSRVVPPPAQRGRPIAIVIASCLATAVLAVVLTKSCNQAATVEQVARADAAPPIDAGVAVVARTTPDAAPRDDGSALAALVGDRLTAKPKRAGSGSAARAKPAPTPITREPAGSAPPPDPDPPPPTPPPRAAIHERVVFGPGDSSSSSVPAAVIRQVVDAYLADPSRRVVLTGYAEDDERGELSALARARANAVMLLLTGGVRRMPRDRIEISSTLRIEPRTANGSNRRVDIDMR